ncbi:putative HtpX-like protease [Parafrankia sp. Ea1.12]|nr:putative HtpX-like protease [Parafrankia sp. Ea1.12]
MTQNEAAQSNHRRARHSDHPRANILSYPPQTTGLFIIFILALIGTGLYIGTWIHNEFFIKHWLPAILRCRLEASETVSNLRPDLAILEQIRQTERCEHPAEMRRALFALAGAATVGICALAILYLNPIRIRRRRKLGPPKPELRVGLDKRVETLAAEEGIRRVPTVSMSPEGTDAFSYGAPGKYAIALPRKLAVSWQKSSLFDPVVRHEIAHIWHRDVAFTWLAISVQYVLVPLLALPLAVGLIGGDRSLLGDYVWRAALLAFVTGLVIRALLRAREHDADLRAARTPERLDAMEFLVPTLRSGAIFRPSSKHSKLRQRMAAMVDRLLSTHPRLRQRLVFLNDRFLSKHPTPDQRSHVLAAPEQAARISFIDGLVAAFFVSLTVPLVTQVASALLAGPGHSDLSVLIASLLLGPLLGASVGLGLWRQALVSRAAGRSANPMPVAIGIAAGLVLGQTVSVSQSGSGAPLGFSHPVWFPIAAVLGFGSAILSASLGEIWADVAPSLRSARTSWLTAIVVNSIFFSAVLWVVTSLQLVTEIGGLNAVLVWLLQSLSSWLLLTSVGMLVAVAVAAFILHGRQPRKTASPGWLVSNRVPTTWPDGGRINVSLIIISGVAAGLAGTAVLISFRLIVGPATQSEIVQRAQGYMWLAAATGTVTALMAGLLEPRRGLAAGALAGPLATVVAITGYVLFNSVLGGDLSWNFFVILARPPLALEFALFLFVAPMALFAWPTARCRTRLLPLTTVAFAVIVAAATLVGRNVLVPSDSAFTLLL